MKLWFKTFPLLTLFYTSLWSTFTLGQDSGGGSGRNDVVCGQESYLNQPQIPPPVIFTEFGGSTVCGCESDVGHYNASSYQVCNSINPPYGETGYAGNGLQNSCYLDQSLVARCGTVCIPNYTSNGSGGCIPNNGATSFSPPLNSNSAYPAYTSDIVSILPISVPPFTSASILPSSSIPLSTAATTTPTSVTLLTSSTPSVLPTTSAPAPNSAHLFKVFSPYLCISLIATIVYLV